MKNKYPTYELEDELKILGYTRIAGIDEAGRGPLCGPVVAAAVWIPDEHVGGFIGKVKDSKKLSDIKRRKLFSEIIKKCYYGIGIVGNTVIDQINILEATKLAMRKAFNNIAVHSMDQCDAILVDGNVDLDPISVPFKQIINGDNLSVSIAAGSILAKVTRDDIMEQMHYVYPVYGWLTNKGYGTKEHIAAIEKYGATEFHRYSFNKVK